MVAWVMLQTGLDFAPGTTDECKRLIGRLFSPTDIFAAYREGRAAFSTGDLVLLASEHDPSGFKVQPRVAYLKDLKDALGHNAAKTLPVLTISQKTAHAVMRLPGDSDAMWLVIARGKDMPVMCVLYATPYATGYSAVN